MIMPQDQQLYSIKDLRNLIGDFVEIEYPKETKGADKGTGERGPAIVAITLFTCYLMKLQMDEEKKNESTTTTKV